MVQKRFTNYKAPTESFPLGEQHIGILKPGRYNGFDTLETADNINLIIGHSGRIIKGQPDGTSINDYGTLITPTGLVIHEEGPINVAMPSNTGKGSEYAIRKFILICEHNYQAVQGGVPASYFIVGNPFFGEELPALPNPTSQVILGIITREYGTTASFKYEKVQAPILSDRTAQELYNIVEPFIKIPTIEELPDVRQMMKDMILKNRDRSIITGTFDIAGPDIPWSTLSFSDFLGNDPGHNLENHIVRWRHTRTSSGSAFVDVQMGTNEKHDYRTELIWQWENVRLMDVVLMNDPGAGPLIYAVQEIRDDTLFDPGMNNATIKRFYVGEEVNSTQVCSLRLAIQNKYVAKIPLPPKEDIEGESGI